MINIKSRLEPNIILTIDIHSYLYITIVIKDKEDNILDLFYIQKNKTCYNIRRDITDIIKKAISEYEVDTIIMEKNQLFIDKIDRYPDPLVYRNITLGFGIKISIEDNFYDMVKYIIELPQNDWRSTILNRTTKYSIDLYKSHILNTLDESEDRMKIIETYNFYKVLCLSESVKFDNLMNRKYQTNKGD